MVRVAAARVCVNAFARVAQGPPGPILTSARAVGAFERVPVCVVAVRSPSREVGARVFTLVVGGGFALRARTLYLAAVLRTLV